MADGINIADLNIRVQSDALTAINSIKELTASLNNLRGNAKGGAGLGSVINAINKLSAAFSVEKTQGINEYTQAVSNLTRELQGLRAASMGIRLPSVSRGAIASTSSAATVSAAQNAVSDLNSNVSIAVNTNGSLAKDALPNTTKENLKSTAREISNVGKEASKSTSKLGKFFESIKRIALYRLIRTAIKEIGEAFKEGFNNLYQYSKLINGDFARSMDMAATSSLYLKNSLAAAVSPAINALIPIVDRLVDKFVDLVNIANKTIAILTGASSWTKALKYQTEYAEATGKAAKAQATLLSGFDEINKMEGANSSGSSGYDYSKMFETIPLATQSANTGFLADLASLSDDIKNKWKDIKDVAGQLFDKVIKPGYEKVLTPLYNDLLKPLWEDIVKPISNWVWNESIDDIKLIIGDVGIQIDDASTVLGWLTRFYNFLKDKLKPWFDKNLPGLSAAFDTIWELVSPATEFDTRTNIIHVLTQSLDTLFNSDYTKEEKWAKLKETIVNGINGMRITNTLNLGKLELTTDGIVIGTGLLGSIADALKSIRDSSKIGISIDVSGTKALEVLRDINRAAITTLKTLWAVALAGTGIGVAAFFREDFQSWYEDKDNLFGNSNKIPKILSEAGVPDTDATVAYSTRGEDGSIYDVYTDGTRKKRYATGGFPEDGLFFANHNELVGSFSNGRTAVANNTQIIEGIKQGVKEAMNESNGGGGDWTINVVDANGNVKSTQTISALQRRNRRDGKTVVAIGY